MIESGNLAKVKLNIFFGMSAQFYNFILIIIACTYVDIPIIFYLYDNNNNKYHNYSKQQHEIDQ